MTVEPEVIRRSVEALYDNDTQREWEREDRHRTEFAITRRALAQHLPPPPARILDCGGGPGRYAIPLAQQGYDVTLFDLSAGNLAFAQEKAREAGAMLAFAQGTATDLSRFADAEFDAVLLMGPLYHLLTEDERLRALTEARRVLKPGGPLFAAFISRFAAHRDAAMKYPTEPVEMPGLYEDIERTGQLPPREGVKFVAYFAHPEEVEPLVRRAGFEVDETLSVEGLVSVIENGVVNALTGPAWQWWLEANWRACHDPALRGAVEHLLVVARNPAWRAVMRDIAITLRGAGIPFTVIGGASVALHGVPIRVKDIDILTTVEGAYRFGELLASYATSPVALSDNGVYRSHFGRFNFGGVDVEVMAALERWHGGQWIDTTSATLDSVDLDGVAVPVPWLEEEWLAYIRRGRLDRAAAILPRCDHGRLLALLRGETPTNML